jgi:hypothetical protein
VAIGQLYAAYRWLLATVSLKVQLAQRCDNNEVSRLCYGCLYHCFQGAIEITTVHTIVDYDILLRRQDFVFSLLPYVIHWLRFSLPFFPFQLIVELPFRGTMA